MAQIQEQDKGKGKKGRQKKQVIHVDFTPMVDMNMLLITFFMLCTSLSKPQTMEIAMPNKDKDPAIETPGNVNNKRAITLLLDGDDKIYYYTEGDVNTLKETNYKPTGLRAYLLQRNQEVVREIKELNKLKLETNMADTTYARIANSIKKEEIDAKGNPVTKQIKTAPVVIIKATNDANYKNLIDALDEMQICNIGIYAILDIVPEDIEVLDAYKEAKSKALAGN